MRILKTKRSFRKEFKRQIKYAIAAAVGFTIAFAWRDAVFSATLNLVDKFEQSNRAIMNPIFASLLITLLGVLVIVGTSKLLADK